MSPTNVFKYVQNAYSQCMGLTLSKDCKQPYMSIIMWLKKSWFSHLNATIKNNIEGPQMLHNKTKNTDANYVKRLLTFI